MSICTVVFDFGNVLAYFSHRKAASNWPPSLRWRVPGSLGILLSPSPRWWSSGLRVRGNSHETLHQPGNDPAAPFADDVAAYADAGCQALEVWLTSWRRTWNRTARSRPDFCWPSAR